MLLGGFQMQLDWAKQVNSQIVESRLPLKKSTRVFSRWLVWEAGCDVFPHVRRWWAPRSTQNSDSRLCKWVFYPLTSIYSFITWNTWVDHFSRTKSWLGHSLKPSSRFILGLSHSPCFTSGLAWILQCWESLLLPAKVLADYIRPWPLIGGTRGSH